MTIQTTPENERWDSFETVLLELEERIKSSKRGTPELNAIVDNGLKVARQADKLYKEEAILPKNILYSLYKVICELWFYQHLAILENIKAGGHKSLTDYSPRVVEHRNLAIKLLNYFNQLENISDRNELRNNCLSGWSQSIDSLMSFVDIPIVTRKNSRARRLPSLSPEARYVIFATFLLVLGIIIATLLLIR